MDLEVIQEQLRPKTWNDLIGLDFKPNGVNTEKELLIDMMDRDDALSVIFYGPPGTGKTSAVMLAAEQYLGSHMDSKFKKYNASTSVLVDTIKNDVIDFAGSEDDTGLRNIIFFDEVDGVFLKQDNAESEGAFHFGRKPRSDREAFWRLIPQDKKVKCG